MALQPCYRIKNWNKHYENNRTRTMDVMRWVPIPNKFDGDGYTELIEGTDGVEIYGAWVAIIGVASKCHPRGTLLRENGLPHTADTIARQTRLPASSISKALTKAASKSVGWIEVYDLETDAQSCQVGDTKMSGGCGQTTIEGKGREGKGIENIYTQGVATLSNKFALPSSEKEAVEWAGAAGVPPDFSKALFHQCEGRGWVDAAGQAIQMWSSYAKGRYLKEAFNKPAALAPGKPTQQTEKAPTIFALKAQKEAKEELARQIKNRYCSDVAMGEVWSDEEQHRKYRAILKEINQLTERMASCH